jgi:hypothetical protein
VLAMVGPLASAWEIRLRALWRHARGGRLAASQLRARTQTWARDTSPAVPSPQAAMNPRECTSCQQKLGDYVLEASTLTQEYGVTRSHRPHDPGGHPHDRLTTTM